MQLENLLSGASDAANAIRSKQVAPMESMQNGMVFVSAWRVLSAVDRCSPRNRNTVHEPDLDTSFIEQRDSKPEIVTLLGICQIRLERDEFAQPRLKSSLSTDARILRCHRIFLSPERCPGPTLLNTSKRIADSFLPSRLVPA